MFNTLCPMLVPELVLISGAIIVLLLGASKAEWARLLPGPMGFGVTFIALVVSWYSLPAVAPQCVPPIQLGHLTWYVRVTGLGIGVLLMFTSWSSASRGHCVGVALTLFSLAGLLVTAAADDMIVLFGALEVVSFSGCGLVLVSRDKRSSWRDVTGYVLLALISAALTAGGLALLYQNTQTTGLTGHVYRFDSRQDLIAMALVFAGVAFKLGIVPFHAFTASVWQHVSASSTGMVSGVLGFVPKFAAVVALIKLLIFVQPSGWFDTGWTLSSSGFWLLWGFSVATMTLGTVFALAQVNLRRILAYSSVSHSGMILLALLVGPAGAGGPLRNGVSAALFYVVAFGAMNLGTLMILSMLRHGNRAVEQLDDLAGLSQCHPFTAVGLTVCVCSLMGVPATAGFFAKLYALSAALSAGGVHSHRTALMVLVVIASLNAAVAVVYYLRIIAACYVHEPAGDVSLVARRGSTGWGMGGAMGWGMGFGAVLCGLLVLALGLWPTGLMKISQFPQQDISWHKIVREAPVLPAE